MKTAIVIGRFQPITVAHYNMIKEAVDMFDETYVVIINSKSSIVANSNRRMRASGISNQNPEYDLKDWSSRKKAGTLSKYNTESRLQKEKEKNPFSGMMRKKMVYKAFNGKLHESHILTQASADIRQIVNKISYISKNTDFTLISGPDRSFYDSQIKSGFEKGYFLPSIDSIDVHVLEGFENSGEEVRATVVRNAIINRDNETFKRLTPSNIHEEYNSLRKILVQDIEVNG